MIRIPFFRTILVAMIATVAALPAISGSAAIPCQEHPIIEPDPNMVIPLIYIELPVTVEAALGRGQAADREGSSEIEEGFDSVRGAAENQFRCLNYGNDQAFAGNSTPEQRVIMWAVPAIDPDENYIDVDSVFVEHLGTPIQLEDGRILVDFGIIVNGSQYLTGELVFTEEADEFYLDGSAIANSVELNEESVSIEISPRFTREVKVVNASGGDRVVFKNLEEEDNADIVILDDDGEIVFDGGVKGNMLVGGEDRNVFVVHDLEPGNYQITITFLDDDVTYGMTLVVDEVGDATPSASPAS